MRTIEAVKQFCRLSVLNPISEHVMMYPIKKGCEFKEMDIVVLSKETCEVCHPEHSKEYIAVGRAIKTVSNEYGTEMLLCKDGIIMFKNLFDDSNYTVQESDVGKDCYLEHDNIVSMNKTERTVAGKVLSVVEDSVIVRIDIYEGEE